MSLPWQQPRPPSEAPSATTEPLSRTAIEEFCVESHLKNVRNTPVPAPWLSAGGQRTPLRFAAWTTVSGAELWALVRVPC